MRFPAPLLREALLQRRLAIKVSVLYCGLAVAVEEKLVRAAERAVAAAVHVIWLTYWRAQLHLPFR
jgi:hypothetical protein